jgi:NAD+ kinase
VRVFLCARAGRVVRLGSTTFYQRARRKLRLADPAELDEVDVTRTA